MNIARNSWLVLLLYGFALDAYAQKTGREIDTPGLSDSPTCSAPTTDNQSPIAIVDASTTYQPIDGTLPPYSFNLSSDQVGLKAVTKRYLPGRNVEIEPVDGPRAINTITLAGVT